MTRPASDFDGFRLWPGLLDRAAQEALRDEVFARMRGRAALHSAHAEIGRCRCGCG